MSTPTRKTYYGSGSIYEIEYVEGTTQIPTTQSAIRTFIETYCIEDNQIGYLKNGFQFEMSPDVLEDQSDLGEMKISVITKENATVTFALFNANGATISKLYPTASTTDGVTIVGGLKGTTQKDHVIIFVAADETYGKTVLIAVGKNTSGFNLNWNPDSVEPFSCTYSLVPYNSSGNIMVFGDIESAEIEPTYTVTLNTNGGSITAGHDVTSYTAGTGATLPTAEYITKSSNTFAGWYDNGAFTGNPVTAITINDTGNKSYYAKWEANT